MKLHKAIKKLKEGYDIRSDLMNEGYVFLNDDRVWYSNNAMHFDIEYLFDHHDFERDWEIVE